MAPSTVPTMAQQIPTKAIITMNHLKESQRIHLSVSSSCLGHVEYLLIPAWVLRTGRTTTGWAAHFFATHRLWSPSRFAEAGISLEPF
jgi:hypothetical protein